MYSCTQIKRVISEEIKKKEKSAHKEKYNFCIAHWTLIVLIPYLNIETVLFHLEILTFVCGMFLLFVMCFKTNKFCYYLPDNVLTIFKV